MIEFHNETDEDYNVVVCETVMGNIHVHLVGDKEELHGDESTTIEAKDHAYVDVNADKL